MLSLKDFLKSSGARRLVHEANGELLADLSAILRAGIYGGNHLAYDVTAVLVGPEMVRFGQNVVSVGLPDPSGDQPDYVRLVEDLLEQTIAQRMTARAADKVAASPHLRALAATSGMPFPKSTPNTKAGNALLYLSELGAAEEDEIALVVCCAGLSRLHCERYAEAMAALCKFALLGELARINASLAQHSDAA